MRLKSIQSKVLLLFLLLTVVLLLVMSVMVRYGVNKQFNAYRLGQAAQLNRQVVATLEDYYQQNGSWDALKNNGRLWSSLLLESVMDSGVLQSRRGQQIDQQRGRGLRREAPGQLLPHFNLLDAEKTPVVGRMARSMQQPIKQQMQQKNNPYHSTAIKSADKTVGYILALKPRPVSIQADAKLNQGIKLFLWTLGLVMLVISLLATWPIARYITRPIKALNTATQQAAAGDFSIRTQVDRNDELGQLSQNFNVLTGTLQSNAEVQRNMMADISHELRTPVAVMQAQIESIQDGVHQANEKSLGLLHQQITSLGHLINDLHQLSIADLGNMQYQMQVIDLKPIVDAAIGAVQFSANKKNIKLESDFQQIRTQTRVLGDAGRLQQMLNNLLVNSVAYTDVDGVIQLSLFEDKTSNELVIEVQDSAPGLKPHEMVQMFERLYRQESSRSKKTGGSGLGLAIVKKIIEAHGGTIEANPSELGGVNMTVRLPKHA